MMIFQIVLQAARWNVLINTPKKTQRITHAFRLTYVSTLANFIFISSISGPAIRLILTHQNGISWVRTICATITDKAFSVFGLAIMCVLTAPIALYKYDNLLFKSGTLNLFILITAGIFSILLFFYLLRFIQRNWRHHRTLLQGAVYLRHVIREKTFLRLAFYSFLAQIGFFMGVYYILVACGSNVPLSDLIPVLPVISLVAAIPISVGGWGVREGAFVLGLSVLGIPPETALLASLQIGICSMIAAIIMGLPVLLDADILMDFRRALLSGQHLLQTMTHPHKWPHRDHLQT